MTVKLMGIVNVTPDSFSDGGKFLNAQSAIDHGRQLMEEGADILDIGGESTRPGANAVSPEEEQMRVLPVIAGLKNPDIPLSIDTRNASTMRGAIAAGASIVNDVTALTGDAGSMDAVKNFNGTICLMHMQGTPATMQAAPAYNNVVEDVFAYLQARIDICVAAGIEKDRIYADPGFGFGKTFDHNQALLDGFERFHDLGVKLLAGVSRKTFAGITAGGLSPEQRLAGSLKLAEILAGKGVHCLRVHDVALTRAALS